MFTKFVVISEGRTGSNYLMYLLRSHPEIVMYSELFNRNDPKVLEFLKLERRLVKNDEDPAEYISKEVFCPGYPSEVRGVGFKLMYYQARTKNWEGLWKYLKETKDIKIVHMMRKNLLARYLSLVLARRENVYITFDAKKGIHKDPIFLDYDDFDAKLNGSVKDRNNIKNFFRGSDYYEVYYENLLENKNEECSRLQEFLNLSYKTLTSGTIQQRQGSLKEMVMNYDELKEKYKNTPHNIFFEE